MRQTINHSQVKVTDRSFASWAANQMKFDNIDGILLSSPALIHFPRLLQDSGCFGYQTITKIWRKKKGRGEANLSEEANLIVCFTFGLIKTSYLLDVSSVIYQIFLTSDFGLGWKKIK